MGIIGVLDLKAGQVVRAIGGRRQEYQPIRSRLTASSRPVEVALAFREHFGLNHLYLADLDAIAGAPPSLPLYAELRQHGFHLWVDAGVRDEVHAAALAEMQIDGVVLGLETLNGPSVVACACRNYPNQVVFSLDLQGGALLGNIAAWNASDGLSLAFRAVALGVRRLLVLDLVRVGGNSGPGTEELCSRVAAAFPHVDITAGGGVRRIADVTRLYSCGVQSILMASALHDCIFTQEELSASEKQK